MDRRPEQSDTETGKTVLNLVLHAGSVERRAVGHAGRPKVRAQAFKGATALVTLGVVEYARRCMMCGTWDAKRRWTNRDEAVLATDFVCEPCAEHPGNYEVGVLDAPYSGARL